MTAKARFPGRRVRWQTDHPREVGSQHWRTRSAARSTPPPAARICSSAGAGSWVTGPATWLALVERCRPEQRSMAFPPGIAVEGATPNGEGRWCDHWGAPPSPPGGAPAPRIWGSLPPLPPPPGAAQRVRRGHAGRRPATVASADAGNPCQPLSNKAFQARPRPQRRGASPSEREALWWLRLRATW